MHQITHTACVDHEPGDMEASNEPTVSCMEVLRKEAELVFLDKQLITGLGLVVD